MKDFIVSVLKTMLIIVIFFGGVSIALIGIFAIPDFFGASFFSYLGSFIWAMLSLAILHTILDRL
jgi:hypothetical protein